MSSVFLVWHSHSRFGETDDKLIGVYNSTEDAAAAVARLSTQPGFKEYPNEFEVVEYEIGKDHWTEGFVTVLGSAE